MEAWEKRLLAEPGAEERVREAQERLERAVSEIRAEERAEQARYEAEERVQEDWPSARLRDEVERLQAELEGVRRGLGRPTRDVNGFWEYGVWDRVQGTIGGRGTKELVTRRMEELGPRGEDPRYVLVRRWLGGWEAGD